MYATLLFADDKGTCPPAPPAPAFDSAKKLAQGTPTNAQGQRIGTVTLLTVISDTGHVCSAQVIQGIEKKIDAGAVKAVLQWKFHPAIKNGHRVPTVANIQIHYRLDKDGNVISDPDVKPATEPGSH